MFKMKKSLMLIVSTLFSTLIFFTTKNKQILITKSLTSPDWVQCNAQGYVDVTGDSNEYMISDLSAYGERVRTLNSFELDGLSFEYTVKNMSAEPNGEKFNLNGFYFSNNLDAYVGPTDHSNNEAIFTFTSKLAINDNQDRFGIFAHHNIFEPGDNLANVKCYVDENKTQKGFGFSDGTMVMSHHSNDITGFRFKFKKVNSSTYKVSIYEIYANTMWQDHFYNYNYDNGKTFAYLDASSFNLDSNGKTHLFCYGYKTDDASLLCIPELHISKLKNTQGCLVSFISNGGTSVDSQVINEGEKAIKPNDPTKEGFKFQGWYTDNELNNLFDFNQTVNDDVVLFAGWSILTFTVKFDSQGIVKISDKIVEYNDTVKEPKLDLGGNIEFEGWFTTSNYDVEFDFENTPITQDTIIYGKFHRLPIVKKQINPLIIVIPCSVVGLLASIYFVCLIIYNKKKKIALVKINQARKEFKEKNRE